MSSLPTEQWQQVLAYVPPEDLCNVVLTSRYMNSVASWPELWKEMKVNMDMVNESGMAALYSVDRFKKITTMTVVDGFVERLSSNAILRLLNEIPGSPLENVSLQMVDLRHVDPSLLVQAANHLHTFNLGETDLASPRSLLEAVISSNTLVNLSLLADNLSEVPAELLAEAVSRLHTVNLAATQLTTEQCVKLLEAIISSNTLVDVNLQVVNLIDVPADLLARAVSRLHTVNLGYEDHEREGFADILTKQCVKVLEAIISSDTLVNLNLWCVNLSGVPAELLAKAVSRLHTVNLNNTQLTTDQCVKMLETSISSNTLVDASLQNVDYSGVPAEILARAISRLRTVNMDKTHLTTDQCVKLMEGILSSNTLVDLNLRCVNLSGVPDDLLSSAVFRLHTVDLRGTELTYDQRRKLPESYKYNYYATYRSYPQVRL